MIVNQIDLGQSHPWAVPEVGQAVAVQPVEGYEPTVWSHGSIDRQQHVMFWLQEWQGIGGQAAGSRMATLYLLKQLEELASNRDMQPAYIQWNATAQSGAPLNASELHDGWYYIDRLAPNYARYVVSGIVECSMTVTQVAAAAPRSVALDYSGGALSTNYSGTALNLISLPVGSTALEASVTRTGGEGAIPCILSPVASPEPVVLSATIANIFKGGVHVYDTINTSSNAVPTAASGLFVNANWVEVFYTDHDFVGDCVITNGLQLLLIQNGQTNLCLAYLWNTSAANVGWQQYGTVAYVDTSGLSGTLRGYTLIRVGPEEVALRMVASHVSDLIPASFGLRLQRGRYEVRLDYTPLTAADATSNKFALTVISAPKIAFNSTKIADYALDASAASATDYGYGSGFIANSADPFIVGLLYQSQPGGTQPNDAGTSDLRTGDTTSLAVNAQRSYGFFAIPYGVSGSYSTANLQAEGESGTLDVGWSSVADAAASAGNTAKCASGTVANRACTFGSTTFVPAPGTYDVWFRVKVTTNVGSALEMTLGLEDVVGGIFVPGGSTTFNRTAMTTSYAWYRAATAVVPTATKTVQFRALTALTLGTDWFIDEACLVPKTLTTANTGPQDIYQQWAFDRSAKLIRP